MNRLLQRARLGAALTRDGLGALRAAALAPRRDQSRTGLICLIDLAQDADLILPIAAAARDSGRFDVRVVATHWLNYAAPAVPERIRAFGFNAERPTRQAVLAGFAPFMRGWDCLLTASETTSLSHRFAHAVTQRAQAAGLRTFTLQHGLENIGLTYEGDGPHDFASDVIFTWNNPQKLPDWVSDDVRGRCVGVGRVTPPPARVVEDGAVAIFENLHWARYTDAYRDAFIRDLLAVAAARPQTQFVVKPHPAGRWLSTHADTIAGLPNLTLADASTSADALIARASKVITTPSTIAHDSARAGKDAAVAGYGLDLTAYAPLTYLNAADGWAHFLDQPADRGRARIFSERHALTRNALPAILDQLASGAALEERPTRPLATALVRLSRALPAPFSQLISPRFVCGGLGVRQSAYRRWVAAYDCPSETDLTHLRRAGGEPVTIIIDARGASAVDIARSAQSARAQTAPLADCIVVETAAALHKAIRAANGATILMLTAGDSLAPHALSTLKRALDDAPDAPFAYADEDWLGLDGTRQDPYFKPAWSRDLFLAQDYAARPALIRAPLVKERSWTVRSDATALYDLLLSLTADSQSPAHAPHILLHRTRTTSQQADREAIDALRSTGCAESVEPIDNHTRRIIYALPKTPPLTSIIIPTRDRADLLERCITSLRRQTALPTEFIIIDNQSEAPQTLAYFEELRARNGFKIIAYPHPFNFSAMNNQAAAVARGELLVFANNDIEALNGDWLREMASLALRPGIGAVGAMLTYADGAIQHAGCVLGMGGVAGHIYEGWPSSAPGHGARLRAVQDVSAVTAACMAAPAAAFRAIGGFDEHFPVAYNDIDLCLRLRKAGYKVLWTPHARLLHAGSASRGADRSGFARRRLARDKARMRDRWGPSLDADPFYSPNLSLDDTDCSLAFPPRTPRPW